VLTVLLPLLAVGLRASSSWASIPSALTLSPTEASATWTGETFSRDAVSSPDTCPPATDPASAVCDHLALIVSVPASYWDGSPGSLEASIRCDDPRNDFDLYVYRRAHQSAQPSQ